MTLASIYARSAASGIGEMHSISADIAIASVWLMRGVPEADEDDEEEEDDDKKHGDDDEEEDEDDDGEGYSE
jgi:hypothetical protein